MVIPKKPFPKILDYKITTMLKCFFSTITRYIENSMFKDTLLLKILRTWIKIRAVVLSSKNENQQKCLENCYYQKIQPHTSKNIEPK